jgi:hypothetical protein
MITVACLFYGDYDKLARRLLESLSERLPSPDVGRVILRGNTVSTDTYKLLKNFERDCPCPVDLKCYGLNQYKYPVLREVVALSSLSIDDTLMWFDDDSCIRPEARKDWFSTAKAALGDNDFAGEFWTWSLHRGQANWIKSRPWYAGRPISNPMSFPQGAWWMARVDTLRRFNWPDPGINHRGGDVMTGALIEQQGLKFINWKAGVAINADDKLVNSASPRRGYDEKSVGSF